MHRGGARVGEGRGRVIVEAMGLVAWLLTTIAFVPQVANTARTGSARDFSRPMLMLFVAGLALWPAYGALIGSAGLVLANGVTPGPAGYILVVKLRRG